MTQEKQLLEYYGKRLLGLLDELGFEPLTDDNWENLKEGDFVARLSDAPYVASLHVCGPVSEIAAGMSGSNVGLKVVDNGLYTSPNGISYDLDCCSYHDFRLDRDRIKTSTQFYRTNSLGIRYLLEIMAASKAGKLILPE